MSTSEEPPFALVRKLSALDKPPPLIADVFFGWSLRFFLGKFFTIVLVLINY